MAVYRPTYTDKKTGLRKESRVWWYNFTFAGKRIQESSKSPKKTIAQQAEKNRRAELERAYSGEKVEAATSRIRSVSDCVKQYQKHYAVNHRPASVAFMKSCLNHIDAHLGSVLLCDLTEDRIREYMSDRLDEEASGRAINGELGELSRAIGKPWKMLWPAVRKCEENHDVGKALSAEEEARLLRASDAIRSPNIRVLVRLSLMTGMRAGEMLSLQWQQVDFEDRAITVGKAKTDAGTGRVIPITEPSVSLLQFHAAKLAEKFGPVKPTWYVFPFGTPYPSDPEKPMTELKTGWETIRTNAKVKCRWHDLRHTFATKLAEAGTPESTMKALMGHMSQRMLERYSHIRMQAKRAAVEAVKLPIALADAKLPAKESTKVAEKPTVN